MLDVPPIILVFYALAFLGGVATLPIIAWGLGGLLPAFLAEPLANALFALAFLGIGDPTIEQTKTGEYVVRPGDSDVEPESCWRQWAFARFALAVDLDDDAWGDLPINPSDVETEPVTAASVGEVSGMIRGGIKSFVPIGNSPRYYLPVGNLLSVFDRAGGAKLAFDAGSTAEKEHGGDTNQYSPKMRLMGHIVFAVLGAGMGFLFFLGGGA